MRANHLSKDRSLPHCRGGFACFVVPDSEHRARSLVDIFCNQQRHNKCAHNAAPLRWRELIQTTGCRATVSFQVSMQERRNEQPSVHTTVLCERAPKPRNMRTDTTPLLARVARQNRPPSTSSSMLFAPSLSLRHYCATAEKPFARAPVETRSSCHARRAVSINQHTLSLTWCRESETDLRWPLRWPFRSSPGRM